MLKDGQNLRLVDTALEGGEKSSGIYDLAPEDSISGLHWSGTASTRGFI